MKRALRLTVDITVNADCLADLRCATIISRITGPDGAYHERGPHHTDPDKERGEVTPDMVMEHIACDALDVLESFLRREAWARQHNDELTRHRAARKRKGGAK